jgi:hypothetical protein
VGGAVNGTATVSAQEAVADTQVQAQVQGGAGVWSWNVILDLHADPLAPSIVTPVVPQEASVRGQFGAASVTTGVFNPQMALEDWDPWVNYMPAFSVLFWAASPGQVAGGMAGIEAGPGEAFIYGGTDLSWGWPAVPDFASGVGAGATFGAGYTAETDTWGTWSGVAAYPEQEVYGAYLSGEVYLGSAATVALDGAAGTMSGAPWGGLQAYVVALPEAIVQPVVRIEGVLDPDAVLASPHDLRASVGALTMPVPWLHVAVEGDLARTSSGWVPSATVSLTGLTPASEEE